MISVKIKTFLLTFCFVFLLAGLAGADLTINLVAVNASDEVKKVPVKFYIPKELAPEDVLDMGDLKLDYDVDKPGYFMKGEFEFQPKETKTFKIRVKDVWQISPDEINILKKQIEETITIIKNPEQLQLAENEKEKIFARLDYIEAQQASYSANIERRIEEYRGYRNVLEDIRKKAFSADFLSHLKPSTIDENKTVKLVLEVKNPSDTEEKTFQQKHYLPKEILSEHIVDAQGFDVRFDNDKQKYYLSKEDTFKPAEVKKYEITIRDTWNFSLNSLDALEERVNAAMTEISDSDFVDSGNYLSKRITDQITAIRNSQLEGQSIKDHIGTYRVNKRRYDAAESDVEKIEQMLAIVRAKKLEDLEKGKVQNILQKLQALRGLSALSDAIFKKGISVTTTWRIIMGTLIFIAFFTAYNFFTWAGRSKNMGEEQGPKKGESVKVVPKPGGEAPAEKQ